MTFFRGLFLCLALAGCQRLPAPEGQQGTEFVLGTFCSVTLYEGASTELFNRIFSRLREIEGIMSANREGTDLDRINKDAGIEPVRVPPELFEVLEQAQYYAELSGGAFDPTIGPLVRLWDIGSESPRLPGEEEIRAALDLVDWRDLVLDQKAGTAFLRRRGMALDLGAIAKGYAADEAVRIIAQAGLKRAIVNLGGNIFVYGEKPGKKPWRIGVQDPLDTRGAYTGVLELRNTSVVTSGVYERFFEAEGKRYHHILSTGTGYPLDNGLLSVTITADRSIDADALSTAAFTLGHEQGLALIESLKGVEAVFVFSDMSVRASTGARFELTSEKYRFQH